MISIQERKWAKAKKQFETEIQEQIEAEIILELEEGISFNLELYDLFDQFPNKKDQYLPILIDWFNTEVKIAKYKKSTKSKVTR